MLVIPKKAFQDNDGNLILFIALYSIYTLKRETGEFLLSENIIRIPGRWKLNDIVQEENTNRYWMAAD